MQLTSESIRDGQPIATRYAFCRPDPVDRATFAENLSPHLTWTDVPAGTRSFAVICRDPDAPSRPDDVNQPDREVPADLTRGVFVHWVLVDIPADVTSFDEGAFSNGVVPRGKATGDGPHGTRSGINDYTGWFSGDPDMEGTYRGYDGPCPPWNDALIHRYIFTVYALDIETVDVSGDFNVDDVEQAIAEHILDEAAITATFTLNPRLL